MVGVYMVIRHRYHIGIHFTPLFIVNPFSFFTCLYIKVYTAVLAMETDNLSLMGGLGPN